MKEKELVHSIFLAAVPTILRLARSSVDLTSP